MVTVHGNQECNALATILWDNAFAEPVSFKMVHVTYTLRYVEGITLIFKFAKFLALLAFYLL